MARFDLMSNGENSPRWTASDYTAAAFENMPFIYMWEYQQEYSQILQAIGNWIELSKQMEEGYIMSNPYAGLYSGTKKNEYRLPFFTDYNHNINQSWQENQGPLGGSLRQVGDFIEKVAKVFKPTAGILYPKSWAGSNEGTYSFSFDLINTIDPRDITKNRNFLNAIIGQNLHEQVNAVCMLPPCLYEIQIPGVRYSPACVISALTISNKGTLTRPDGGMIVPDAWGVTIQITELINESRNIFESMLSQTGPGAGMNFNGMKARVFTSRPEDPNKGFVDTIKSTGSGIWDIAKNLVKPK